ADCTMGAEPVTSRGGVSLKGLTNGFSSKRVTSLLQPAKQSATSATATRQGAREISTGPSMGLLARTLNGTPRELTTFE
ncbi:MAG: hypothetical protein J2P54_27140, partial [Bradyrhizobiaceae bacterium]|nr:hypothetical protein [Bradyrhizobiaceae bacterium]